VTLATVAVVYVLMPFLLRTLGEEGYGTWTLITSVTAYLSLLVLGVPMASVRYFAQHAAEGDRQRMNEAIGSCTGLYLIMGAAALLVGAGLFAFFDLTYEIPAALRSEARLAFGLVVLQVSAGFVTQIPFAIMAAYQDFVLRNVILMGSLLLRLGLTLGLLTFNGTMVFLAVIQIACLAFEFSVCWLLVRRRYPGIRMSLTDFDRRMVRRIFSFSLYVLMLSLAGRLAFQTDSLVIAAFLDVGRIPYYAVANSFVVYLMEFLVAIAAVVMPMATTLSAQGKSAELREMFLRWSKIALSLTLMAGLFLMVLGPRFIGWWIDPAFEGPAGEILQILMVSSLVFLPVRGVALPILMGLGKPGLPTIAFLAAGVLNLGLSLLLVRPLGLPGVALGTAVPNVLFALVVLGYACRELQIPFVGYLRYVVPRAVIGSLPALALLLWFRLGLEVHSVVGLAGAGLAMALLFGVTWVLFVYRDDPYLDLRGHLARLLAWSAA
jgi:O-antigen/teichoic acid export membrane protein